MISRMHWGVSVPFAFLSTIACSTVRTERNSGVAATADAATSGKRPAAVPNASIDRSVADVTTAKRRDTVLCGFIVEQLRLVAAWRDRPGDLYGSKAMLCGHDTPAHVCARTGHDEAGFTGVGFSTMGPGALFHFQLTEEAGPKARLTCQTIGLATAKELDRGVERCEMVEKGSLAKMTIIVDSRCDELRFTVFDNNYLAQDPGAANVTPCTKASPERLTATPLSCGPVATFQGK